MIGQQMLPLAQGLHKQVVPEIPVTTASNEKASSDAIDAVLKLPILLLIEPMSALSTSSCVAKIMDSTTMTIPQSMTMTERIVTTRAGFLRSAKHIFV